MNSASASLIYGQQKQIHWTKWNDITWSILFMFQLLVITLLGLSYGIWALDRSESRMAIVSTGGIIFFRNQPTDSMKVIFGIFLMTTFSTIISFLWVKTMAHLAARIVLISFLVVIIICLISGLAFFAIGYFSWGFLLILSAGASLIYFVTIRKYLEFAATILSISCHAIGQLPTILFASIFLLVVQLVWTYIWIIAVIGIATNEATFNIKYSNTYYDLSKCTTFSYNTEFILNPSTTLLCSTGSCKACVCQNNLVKNSPCLTISFNMTAFILLLFCYIWTSTVISNIMYCTTSGAVSHWWYQEIPSKDVVLNNFKRSITILLGSICLGSLLVAIIRTFRIMVHFMMNRVTVKSIITGNHANNNRENCLRRYFRYCLEYILKVLDVALEYFNKFAFCYVALYGHSFCESSRAVLALFRERGWLSLLNNEIIESILSISHAVVGIVTALVTFGYTQCVIMDRINSSILIVCSFIIGYLMCNVTLKIISAAVSTVFVCFAESPEVLLTTHPQRYRELAMTWRKFLPQSNFTKNPPEIAAAVERGDDNSALDASYVSISADGSDYSEYQPPQLVNIVYQSLNTDETKSLSNNNDVQPLPGHNNNNHNNNNMSNNTNDPQHLILSRRDSDMNSSTLSSLNLHSGFDSISRSSFDQSIYYDTVHSAEFDEASV